MNTINQFTEEQIKRIEALAVSFARKLGEARQGIIENEDSFEKKGLSQQLQDSESFRAEYIERAAQKAAAAK